MPNAIQSATLGDPITRLGISLYPVYLQDNHLPKIETRTEDFLDIAEMDIATVPTLMATNLSTYLLLIAAGQHFVGGLQNRTINVSVLMSAVSKTEIPVSCLEAGRWSNRGGYNPDLGDEEESEYRDDRRSEFAQSGYANRRVRVKLNAGLSPMTRESDQHNVWDAVEESLDDAEVASPSMALSAIESVYDRDESRARVLKELADTGPLPQQCGIVITHGDEPVAIEIFGSADLLRDQWEGLLSSYLLETSVNNNEPSADNARAMLAEFGDAIESTDGLDGIGLGTEYHIGDDRHTGRALTYEGSIVHAYHFASD